MQLNGNKFTSDVSRIRRRAESTRAYIMFLCTKAEVANPFSQKQGKETIFVQ